MKSRHSPNLYEILCSAATPKETPLGPAATAVAPPPPPPPPPPPAPVVEEPDPVLELPPPPPIAVERPVERPVVRETPPPAPPPAPAPEPLYAQPAPAGPGERSLKLTYNTVLFGGLVAIGALFLAFTVGVRTGRRQADAPPAPPDLAAPALQVPDGPPPKFTIRLIEYKARDSRQFTAAHAAVCQYKNELDRLGLRDAVVETLGEMPNRRVVLRYGEYTDAAGAAARETLNKLKTLKLDKGSKEATFAKTAQFQTR